MKFFTPEHLARGNSSDQDQLHGIEEAWERALLGYRRRWLKIRDAFPKSVQRFMDDNICLHDAQVLILARSGRKLVMVVQQEPPARNLVLLTFTLASAVEIDKAAMPTRGQSQIIAWLYEEWDLDRRGQYWFEVLLSNGWSVKFSFREFRFAMGEEILTTRNGEQVLRTAVTPRFDG